MREIRRILMLAVFALMTLVTSLIIEAITLVLWKYGFVLHYAKSVYWVCSLHWKTKKKLHANKGGFIGIL